MTKGPEGIKLQEPGQGVDSIKNDADQVPQTVQRQHSMDDILAYNLPAFYMDCRGIYGIVVFDRYISCAINGEDGQYDVKVETLDKYGCFSSLEQWKGFDDPQKAVECLCGMVRVYRNIFKEDLLQEVYDTYGDEW